MYKALSSAWSDKGDQRRALDYAIKAGAVDEELLAKNTSSPAAKMAVAFDIGSIGWAYFLLSDYPHAAENMRRNVALRESVVAANPGDSRAEDRLAYAVRDLAQAEKQLGELAAERRSLLRVMDIYTRHARSGPLMSQSLRRFAMSHYDLGQIELDAGRKVPACVWFRKASDLLDQYQLRARNLAEDAEEADQVRSAVSSCRD
jgi:tetratricopeptide (TPR) repeat protein